VSEGVIVGGWSYVIGAYAVVAVGLALYAVSLFQRLRKARRQLGSSAVAAPRPRGAGTNDR
jgi:CcmD family protein